MEPCNVLIAGRSGVGNNTLTNTLFEGNFAETRSGNPVTPDNKADLQTWYTVANVKGG